MPLSDVAIRNAKPTEKPFKLTDGDGLYLIVTPSGGRWWRLDYRFGGKRKTLSMGTHPETGLKDAREKRDTARKLLAEGQDPGKGRREKKAALAAMEGSTFAAVTAEWLAVKKGKLAATYHAKIENTLNANLLPRIGEIPIAEVTARHVLDAIRPMEERGAVELARRMRRHAASIFSYAAALELVPTGYNPAAGITKDVLATHEKKSFPHLGVGELGQFQRLLVEYSGRPETRIAITLLLHVFCRPGELRAARWEEFDLEAAEWSIPAERMKARKPHWVPLSPQVLALLAELHTFTGFSPYLFPGGRGRIPYMSENTVNKAIRLLGYGGVLVGHGFRATASTALNEAKLFNGDAIERALAHADANEIRRIYDRSEHREERRRMMCWWSTHLEALRDGSNVAKG